jgi:hypothetical protein
MVFKSRDEIKREGFREGFREGKIEALVSVAKQLLKLGTPRGVILSAVQMDDEWLKEVEKGLN